MSKYSNNFNEFSAWRRFWNQTVYTQNGIDESIYVQNFELLQNQINEIMILIREPMELKLPMTQ